MYLKQVKKPANHGKSKSAFILAFKHLSIFSVLWKLLPLLLDEVKYISVPVLFIISLEGSPFESIKTYPFHT